MKNNSSIWNLFLPWNYKLLMKQIRLAYKNYKQHGNFSLNKNSPEYFNQSYLNSNTEYIPEHYFEICEYLPKEIPFTLCDFGCGTGEGLLYISNKFPLAKLSAIDYSEVAISKAKEKVPTATFYCLDFRKVPLPSSYDYILTVETLEHFRNPFKIINRLLNFTQKKIFISVPYTENKEEVGKITLYAKHLFNFNEDSFKVFPSSKVLKITDYYSTTKQKCIFYEISKV